LRYKLKTSRPPPRGFDAFFAFAKERGCLVDGYAVVWRDFAPFWRVELAVAEQREKDRPGKSGGRLEGKGWFRKRVEAIEKRASRFLALRSFYGGAIRLRVHSLSSLLPFPSILSMIYMTPSYSPTLAIRDGRAHKLKHQATYFDGGRLIRCVSRE
jgi:hypothetical protein